MTQIDYFFGLGSPWAYVGLEPFVALAEAQGARVVPHVIPLIEENGGIYSRNRPAARRAYWTADLKRWAHRRGVALEFKGREGLSVRAWTCSGCGTVHDRDVNAARNIRDRGLAWLENEFSKVAEARADDTALNESAGPCPSALAPGHGRPAGGIPVL